MPSGIISGAPARSSPTCPTRANRATGRVNVRPPTPTHITWCFGVFHAWVLEEKRVFGTTCFTTPLVLRPTCCVFGTTFSTTSGGTQQAPFTFNAQILELFLSAISLEIGLSCMSLVSRGVVYRSNLQCVALDKSRLTQVSSHITSCLFPIDWIALRRFPPSRPALGLALSRHHPLGNMTAVSDLCSAVISLYGRSLLAIPLSHTVALPDV